MNAPAITRIQILPYPAGATEPVFLVRVTTDQGVHGIGEACAAPGEDVAEVVEELAVQALGRPVANRNALWQAMCGAAGDWEGPPEVMSACLSALDAAVWEAWCVGAGLPCVEAMGGRVRTALEICLDCGEDIDAAKSAYAAGVRIFGFRLDPREQEALQRLSRLRIGLGPQALMILECSSPASGADEAVALGQALDRLDPYWTQGLLPDGQWRELAQVRERVAAATACGEDTLGFKRFLRPLENACADILTPRLASVGGPSGALALSVAVGMRGLRMCVLPGSTPASALAVAHVSFARPEVYPLRITPPALESLRQALPDAVRDGFLHLNQAPGWSGIQSIAQPLEPLATFEA